MIAAPEKNKKAGVCYAVTDNGIELPVIDITHPAFELNITPESLSKAIDEFVQNLQLLATMPASIQEALASQSVLVRGMRDSAHSITTAMTTYLFKLGPENLGEAWATPIDRKAAAGLTPLSFRIRLRDVAGLLASGLERALVQKPGCPVHLVNIAGGPGIDSINALLLLNRDHRDLLDGRRICIHILDIDQEGPHFGARAVEALRQEGAPLAGLDVSLEATSYDWEKPDSLREVIGGLEHKAVMAGSTEGGLFDYGSDEVIAANLKALHNSTPPDFVMVGSLVQDRETLDPRLRMAPDFKNRPNIRFLGLDAFGRLGGQAGWVIETSVSTLVHHAVRLRKAE
jgi:hypothetical protein